MIWPDIIISRDYVVNYSFSVKLHFQPICQLNKTVLPNIYSQCLILMSLTDINNLIYEDDVSGSRIHKPEVTPNPVTVTVTTWDRLRFYVNDCRAVYAVL